MPLFEFFATSPLEICRSSGTLSGFHRDVTIPWGLHVKPAVGRFHPRAYRHSCPQIILKRHFECSRARKALELSQLLGVNISPTGTFAVVMSHCLYETESAFIEATKEINDLCSRYDVKPGNAILAEDKHLPIEWETNS
uniref:Uncharacterized protein n=1 Tax=Zea mays TaxID=4577 RepID=A0A804N9I2_MAIZE